jgi:hypothetical protein
MSKMSVIGNIKLLSGSFLIFKRIVPPSPSMAFQSVNGFIYLKMNVTKSFEISETNNRATQRYFPEGLKTIACQTLTLAAAWRF